MKVDIIDILEIFDETLPSTHEERGVYWVKLTRPDGIAVILAFSTVEGYVHVMIHANTKVCSANYSFKNCTEIRVLDVRKKCVEIICAPGFGRCFLALLGDSIADYTME